MRGRSNSVKRGQVTIETNHYGQAEELQGREQYVEVKKPASKPLFNLPIISRTRIYETDILTATATATATGSLQV